MFGRPIERRRLLGAVATALTILAVGAWALFLRPTSLGGPAGYVMVSGESMEPTYHNGDFVVSRKQASYRSGDIVVFRVPKGEVGEGHHVIHRIIGGSAESGFTTQGDNRSSPDLWHPTNEDVVGEVWFRVPGVASRWLPVLRTPLALGLFAGLWAFWVAMAPLAKDKARAKPHRHLRLPRNLRCDDHLRPHLRLHLRNPLRRRYLCCGGFCSCARRS